MVMLRTEVEIRTGELADAEVLARVGRESFRDAYGSHSDPADLDSHVQEFFTAGAVRRDMQEHECDYLLATAAGEPGGMAKFLYAGCPIAGGASNALELKQLYVLAAMQGYGLGRHLLNRLSDIGRERKVAGIWLSAWQDADWAVRFYRNNGFSIVGDTSFAVGATEYTDFLMWLSLE